MSSLFDSDDEQQLLVTTTRRRKKRSFNPIMCVCCSYFCICCVSFAIILFFLFPRIPTITTGEPHALEFRIQPTKLSLVIQNNLTVENNNFVNIIISSSNVEIYHGDIRVGAVDHLEGTFPRRQTTTHALELNISSEDPNLIHEISAELLIHGSASFRIEGPIIFTYLEAQVTFHLEEVASFGVTG